MLRRLLPTLAVFTIGFAALLWGLATLQSIFAQERDQARAQVAARRRALRQLALQSLGEELGQQLEAARPLIRKAAKDPLLADERLLLIEDGEQILPRPVRFRAEPGLPAKRLYSTLRAAKSNPPPREPGSPWAQRLGLRRRFVDAVTTRDLHGLETAFRDLLAHRASYVISSTLDIPYMLALLDLFTALSRPDPALMRKLLRDGFDLGRGQHMRSLQRALLLSRARFSSGDFHFLRDRLLALCRTHGVPDQDFSARASAAPRPSLALGPSPPGPALALGGRYYVEPVGARLLGVRVSISKVVEKISLRMRRMGLLSGADTVVLTPGPGEGSGPTTGAAARSGSEMMRLLEDVSLKVRSPRWRTLDNNASARFRLKTMLTVAIGLLVLVIVLLAISLQHRRHRYLQLKSDFVASVSHELRTPLTSIRLLAETMDRRAGEDPRVGQYPGRILRDVDGLIFLVENILSFNRIDRGRFTLRSGAVACDELVGDLYEELTSATSARVEIRADSLDGETIWGDPELLRLLLANLGRNGCLYNNSDPVVLTFDLRRSKGRTLLSVTDNGVGVPDREREKIFDEFYRPPDPTGRGVRGSGLGLAMCRRIMKLHGGNIHVARSGSHGTTFELDFPSRSPDA